MICDQCFNPITSFHWYNNLKLCKSCLHNAQPKKKRRNQDNIAYKPTIYDLKKRLEKQNW